MAKQKKQKEQTIDVAADTLQAIIAEGVQKALQGFQRGPELSPERKAELDAILQRCVTITNAYPDDVRFPIVQDAVQDIYHLAGGIVYAGAHDKPNIAMVLAEVIYAMGYQSGWEDRELDRKLKPLGV